MASKILAKREALVTKFIFFLHMSTLKNVQGRGRERACDTEKSSDILFYYEVILNIDDRSVVRSTVKFVGYCFDLSDELMYSVQLP